VSCDNGAPEAGSVGTQRQIRLSDDALSAKEMRGRRRTPSGRGWTSAPAADPRAGAWRDQMHPADTSRFSRSICAQAELRPDIRGRSSRQTSFHRQTRHRPSGRSVLREPTAPARQSEEAGVSRRRVNLDRGLVSSAVLLAFDGTFDFLPGAPERSFILRSPSSCQLVAASFAAQFLLPAAAPERDSA
jgi:hypothetical protein